VLWLECYLGRISLREELERTDRWHNPHRTRIRPTESSNRMINGMGAAPNIRLPSNIKQASQKTATVTQWVTSAQPNRHPEYYARRKCNMLDKVLIPEFSARNHRRGNGPARHHGDDRSPQIFQPDAPRRHTQPTAYPLQGRDDRRVGRLAQTTCGNTDQPTNGAYRITALKSETTISDKRGLRRRTRKRQTPYTASDILNLGDRIHHATQHGHRRFRKARGGGHRANSDVRQPLLPLTTPQNDAVSPLIDFTTKPPRNSSPTTSRLHHRDAVQHFHRNKGLPIVIALLAHIV